MSSLNMRVLSNNLFKPLLISPMCIHCMQNIQKQILSRSITEEHVTKLTEDTFIGRLLIYLNNENVSTTKNNNCTEILNVLKRNDKRHLKEYNTEQIISTLTSITNCNHIKDRYAFSEILNVLDTECCERLNHLEIRDKFNILHAYMKIIPNKIIQYGYYKMAVEELFKKLEVLNKKDLIQLIFYIGLQKKIANSQYMLKECMKSVTKRFLKDLTIEELCIICNSTFKTSTKIKDRTFLNKITSHLNDNLYLYNDPALFITLIKSVRQNHYISEDLLATLSCTISFNRTIRYYSFTALCHILALYSDFFYFDENLIKAFTAKCIEQLRGIDYSSKNTSMREQPRVKDIKRLLWCLNNLNYKYLKADDIKDVIIPNIMKRLEAGEFKDDCATLVDIILYLWILNYRAYELIPYALTKQNMQVMKASKSPAKYRLNLLLSCIYFEDKTLYRQINTQPPENPKYNVNYEMRKRPILQKILECLKSVGIYGDINKFEANMQIPYLKITGITGYRKNIYKTVHIEVLDEYTTLKNTDHVPIGLMQLKLRILEKLEEGLVVIRASEVNLMTDEELRTFLLDEINFVC